MNILFFDTETNGKPLNYKAPMSQVNNWPRVTQLAWAVHDVGGQLLYERSFLIKPDGWTVPKEEFFIKNNMSTERCEAEGVPIVQALGMFIDDLLLSGVETMVAHNLQFDYNVLGAEMIRAGASAGKRLKTVCTMQGSTNIVKLPGQYGKYKWPTLTELHTFLFGGPFEGAHDALDDVRACAKCYFKLVQTANFL